MKPLLIYRDHDLDLEAELPRGSENLAEDLELQGVVEAMASGDAFVYNVCYHVLLSFEHDGETISYRQGVLSDFLARPELARHLYDISLRAAAAEREIRFSFIKSPSAVLRRSITLLEDLVKLLEELRKMADDEASKVSSEGLTRLFAMLAEQLDDDYFAEIDDHLKTLRFRDGLLVSARLGRGVKGARYVLRYPKKMRSGWRERIGIDARSSYSFEIHPRDDAGARALGQLSDRALNVVANALAQSTDQIVGFFFNMRKELALYLGCLELYDRLTEAGHDVTMPELAPAGSGVFSFTGLYDVALRLRSTGEVVTNSAEADQMALVVVTGANSGGKSTFLRSIGQAHLMAQAGIFVAAKSFRSALRNGVHSHFIREEDASMTSGRFDEELSRMSDIADVLEPRALVLFNESFAATNEREGAEIARQVTTALIEHDVFVVLVTHLFSFTEQLAAAFGDKVLFIRAERKEGGERTFKLVAGRPLPTSYGTDLFDKLQVPLSSEDASLERAREAGSSA